MGKVKKQHFTGDGFITQEERQAMADYDEKKATEMKERLDKIEKKPVGNYMNAGFEPFEDRILVYPDPVEEMAGKLYIPDAVKEKAKPLRGTVVVFGPGKNKELPLTVGMRIVFGNYAGTDITLDNGVKYLIMRQSDVFGVVK